MRSVTEKGPKRVARLNETAFAVWCVDGKGGAALRSAHLEGHLAHVERHHDRFLVVGPMRRDGAAELVGSLFILAAESEDDARAVMSGDPYVAHGVYAEIIYRRLTPAAGRWMGGVIWENADSLRNVADGGR
jgi:uncharacterized protein YciI